MLVLMKVAEAVVWRRLTAAVKPSRLGNYSELQRFGDYLAEFRSEWQFELNILVAAASGQCTRFHSAKALTIRFWFE